MNLTPESNTTSTDAEAEHQLRLLRATQLVRTRQSRRALPLVGVMVFSFFIGYYGEIEILGVLIWGSCVLTTTLLRGVVSRRISPNIENADRAKLVLHERWLFGTSILNSLAAGSGFWWVGLAHPEGNAIYAVMLFSAIYAFGSLVNASIQFQTFVPATFANLGQGVLFFAGLGGSWEPAISIGLLINIMLQIGFSRVNAQQFSDTIKMQSENLDLLEQVRLEKAAADSALKEAERANASKNQFLAAASHDLRQPLHALNLYLGSLEVADGEQQQDIIDKMNDTTSFLNDQFNSLLDLSQFDSGIITPNFRPVRIDQLTDRLISSFYSEAQNKNIGLSKQVAAATINTDPQLLERVLRNLLENAIRYTDEGEVSLSTETDGATFTIKVKDTGRGITSVDQERIFDDFVQVDNASREPSLGVGLGLAIVKRICKVLQHELTLDSEPNKGSTFSLVISEVESTNLEPDTTKRAIERSARVWTVDDNPEILDALRTQLEAWQCDVTLLSCYQDILDAHSDQNAWPDLLLLDDMLGEGHSGLDIAKKLQNWMAKDHIVLITGNTRKQRLAEIAHNDFKFLLKPVSTDDLRKLVINSTTST